jgi:hypothetical protein
VRSLADDIPADQVLGKLGQVALLALPLVVTAGADATADDDERNIGSLDGTSGSDLVLGEGLGHEVLLVLSLDELATLVSRTTVDTILTGASVEDGTEVALDTERRDNTKAPKNEASVCAANAVEKVLVERVNHHDTSNVTDVASGEDARDDRAVASRDEDEGALLTSDGQSLGQSIGRHTGTVRARSAIRPSVTRTVPVAVAVDSAVLPSSVGPVLEVVLGRHFASLKEESRVGSTVRAIGDVAHACKVDLVLVAINVVALAFHRQRSIASAQDEGCGHEDGNDSVDDEDQGSDGNGQPFAQCPACLGTTSKTLLFFLLAPSHYSVCNDTPKTDKSSPSDRGNTRPTLLNSKAGDGKDHDQVNGQDGGDDARGDAHALGGSREEEDGDQEVASGQGDVGEVEETRASSVQTRRRDEDAHEEQNPPDEVDEEEEDGEVSQEADGPQVVGRDLGIVSTASRPSREERLLTAGSSGSR